MESSDEDKNLDYEVDLDIMEDTNNFRAKIKDKIEILNVERKNLQTKLKNRKEGLIRKMNSSRFI